MIDFISSSFRTVISISAWIALLFCVGIGVSVAVQVAIMAGVLAFGVSILLVVMFYGTICLLIQNNELLKRIAERPAA